MERVQESERTMLLRHDDQAYYEGWTDCFRFMTKKLAEGQLVEAPKPHLTVEDIQERYGGITRAKALEIIKAVRRWVGGGKLPFDFIILRSELELWEQDVTKNYKERV